MMMPQSPFQVIINLPRKGNPASCKNCWFMMNKFIFPMVQRLFKWQLLIGIPSCNTSEDKHQELPTSVVQVKR
jgi:hypothetical protein